MQCYARAQSSNADWLSFRFYKICTRGKVSRMSDEFDKQFLVLQQQFINNLAERKQKINTFYLQFIALGYAMTEREVLVDLHRQVHNLTGAAGCYQLISLAKESRKLEDHLFKPLCKNSKFILDEEWQQVLAKKIAALINLIDTLLSDTAEANK